MKRIKKIKAIKLKMVNQKTWNGLRVYWDFTEELVVYLNYRRGFITSSMKKLKPLRRRKHPKKGQKFLSAGKHYGFALNFSHPNKSIF